MINIWVGLPGSGKTLKLAKVALWLLERNRKYERRTGVRRYVISNVKFSKEIEEKYKDNIRYWTELEDLWKCKNVDVIWQEMSVYLDAMEYEKVPREMKRWLAMHRHYGIEIYGDTQRFGNLYNQLRYLVNNVFRLVKVVGSRDISATKPPVKFIWGMVFSFQVDPITFTEESVDYKYKGFKVEWIYPSITKVFNSYEDLDYNSYPPLKHIERTCTVPTCSQFGKPHIRHS